MASRLTDDALHPPDTLPAGMACVLIVVDGEFDEEIATNYEIGWKGLVADGTVAVDVTAFMYDYKDLQVNYYDQGAKVDNVGQVDGAVLDVLAHLVRGTETGQHDLAQLRSIQDWFLKYELESVASVSKVATFGGMVKQYQVVLDPDKLRAYGLPLARIRQAIQRGNQEAGGSVIEMAEAEYMVRATGYVDELDDLRHIPLGVNERGTPILLDDVAEVRLGPQLRRGIAELDGEGEVVGGVIVMRFGENALRTIEGVKQKLAELASGLPDGVEIIETYDRSALINIVTVPSGLIRGSTSKMTPTDRSSVVRLVNPVSVIEVPETRRTSSPN